MEELIKISNLDKEATHEINEFQKEIESLPADKQTMVNNFIKKDLFKYIQFLQNFNEEVKKDKQIKDELFKKLNHASNQIIKDGEDLTQKLENKLMEKRIRYYFRTLISPWPYKSIIMDKGFQKYRGYPGDFEMMDYVYNNTICSNNIFGQYFDMYFLRNAYSEAVRGRKNLMRDILVQETSKTNNLYILNIPCGPSRDVQEFLENQKDLNDFKLLCVDNDKEAIDFSKKSIAGLKKSENIQFKEGNILNFSRNPSKAKDNLGSFDIVYSIGIADYFPDKLLQKFIFFTYEMIKSGGKLIFAFKITNKDPFAPLPPKWFCDWVFVPRSYEDCIKVIKDSQLNNFEIIGTEWEESDRICFISIRKN